MLQQIKWRIFAKQKCGTVNDLIIADCENVFDYSCDFNSLFADRGLGRKFCLRSNKLSTFKKTPAVYLIIYLRYIDVNFLYLQVFFALAVILGG